VNKLIHLYFYRIIYAINNTIYRLIFLIVVLITHKKANTLIIYDTLMANMLTTHKTQMTNTLTTRKTPTANTSKFISILTKLTHKLNAYILHLGPFIFHHDFPRAVTPLYLLVLEWSENAHHACSFQWIVEFFIILMIDLFFCVSAACYLPGSLLSQ